MSTSTEGLSLTTRPAAATWRSGYPVAEQTTNKILEVVAPDGTVVQHMCAECGKTGNTFHVILGHLKIHRSAESKKAAKAPSGIAGFIREHARLMKENNRLAEKVKAERAARMRAERRLQQIDNLFSGSSK